MEKVICSIVSVFPDLFGLRIVGADIIRPQCLNVTTARKPNSINIPRGRADIIRPYGLVSKQCR